VSIPLLPKGIIVELTGNIDGSTRGKGTLMRTRCHECGTGGLLNVEVKSAALGRHWRYFKPQPRTNTPDQEHECDGQVFDWSLEKLPQVQPRDNILRI
jgi:hypothetical protein